MYIYIQKPHEFNDTKRERERERDRERERESDGVGKRWIIMRERESLTE